jgi:hypothetical protein
MIPKFPYIITNQLYLYLAPLNCVNTTESFAKLELEQGNIDRLLFIISANGTGQALIPGTDKARYVAVSSLANRGRISLEKMAKTIAINIKTSAPYFKGELRAIIHEWHEEDFKLIASNLGYEPKKISNNLF